MNVKKSFKKKRHLKKNASLKNVDRGGKIDELINKKHTLQIDLVIGKKRGRNKKKKGKNRKT
jgi:hypothetical protein